MKILVTGGAGFIGSHIVDALVSAGHDVSVIDNLSTGVPENLNSSAKFYQGDITDKEFIKKVIEKERPEIVNHHAAHIHVGHSVEHPEFDAAINILGTINVLNGLIATNSCRKVIFASTGGAMYGNKSTPFDEEMMPAPLSPYGVSKRAAELYLGFFQAQYGISYVALRYANVYGPRQNPHGEAGVVSIFSKNILEGTQPVINGDGKQTRDYVYVDDAVSANVRSLETVESGVFNIGTSVETDVNQIFFLVNEAYGSSWKEVHGPPRPGEQKTSSLSYQKAVDRLGWKPTISLSVGIKKTVDWFRLHPDRV